MRGNLGGNRLRLTKEQREEILNLYLKSAEEGTRLAMSLGLSAAYAYRLANERGILPVTRWAPERFPNRARGCGALGAEVPGHRHDLKGSPAT